MPIIGPKPDENKFETLTLLTPACRFINMSWTVVASSFHSMSQNLYKMFQNIWKAFCHRKWYLLYKNIANMISPMKFDVTESYSSFKDNITEYCRTDISLGPLVLSSSNGLHLKCLTGALFLRAHPFDRLRHPSVSPKVPRNLRFVNTVLEECYMKEYLGSPQYNLKRDRILQGRHERARRRQQALNSWKRLLRIASGAD